MTVHTVRPHETITSIARHYHVTAKALTSSNHLNDANFIQVGQSLQIPRARNLNTPNVADPKPVKQATQAKDHGHTEHFIEDITEAIELGYVITNGWLDELLQRLRHREANESVQHTEPVKFTPAPTPALPLTSLPTNQSSYSLKKLVDVKKDLQERLGKDPHVIMFNGVKLTQNERMQIIASVACCEMSKDGFGSINADQEFVGRKFKHRGIETSYSRIVHIGLSYGVIQYTQDGGGLGRVLERMRTKNPAEFTRIFGGGDKIIADLLVTTTTTGHPDAAADVPLSGQQYWDSIKNTALGKKLKNLSKHDEGKNSESDLPVEREIRGKRVQPISTNKDQEPTDIWVGIWKQRFLEAGAVVNFQEAQLELAVSDYLNPILKAAARNNVRSALALAFITACSVRGGPTSKLSKLFYSAAKEIEISLPLKNGDDEDKIIIAIINSETETVKGVLKHKIGKTYFHEDEVRRIKLLKKDELGFLTEDFYDVSTY